ncbi:MAG: hypothetical protein HY554_16520 [Elusimicrobia bacterium]|nr:hypothetical protein [Elusimicrobiota bacterium]
MENKPQVDLANVDSINNIDTARMALRWALERLHVLEAAKAEGSERLGKESKWRAEAEEEVRRLKTALGMKTAQGEERERYYKKVEGFLSLRLAGQVDIAALAQREAELEQLRQDLEGRLVQLEREFAGRRQSLELEYERLTRQAREAAQSGARDAQAWLSKRHEDFEKEHADALVSLKERELRLAKQETELAERQRRFEEFSESQRARLEADARQLEAQGQARLRTAERLLEERQAALETGWTREKAILVQELALLRRKTQELSPALLEAERRAEEAADALGRAQEGERRCEQKARLAELDRQAAIGRLRELETRAEAEVAQRSDLERRAQAAESAAREAQAVLDSERLRLQEKERGLERALEAWRLAELEKTVPERLAALRQEYAARLETSEGLLAREKEALLRQLQDREELLARQSTDHERGLEELRRRLAREHEERLRAREDQTAAWEAARLHEAAEWRRKLEEAAAKAAELEGRLAEAEGRALLEAEKAKAEGERRKSLEKREAASERLWQEEWDAERNSLIGRIAGLEDALQRARKEMDDEHRQAEERHRQELADASRSHSTWDASRLHEAAEWRRRGEEAVAKAHELEKALADAREARLHAEAQLQGHANERDEYETRLRDRTAAIAQLQQDLRAAQAALLEGQKASREELRAEVDAEWKARLAGEELLLAKGRQALARVTELEQLLAEGDVTVRRAQDVLKGQDEREAALLSQVAERERELARRQADLEAASARAAAEYRERRGELDRLKTEVERQIADAVRRARGS